MTDHTPSPSPSTTNSPNTTGPSRRRFIQRSAAASAALAALPLHRAAFAAGSDALRIGLIGCGGRGTGAAGQALRADSNVRLTAMADAFADKIEGSLNSLTAQKDLREKIDVPVERRFTGFDAYKRVTDNVDVVLLTTPPHFRPMHLKYAIDRGRHVFAEKPVAVDGKGVRDVLATCEQAKKKGLAVVSGLCLRYNYRYQDTIKRLHDGAVGDLVALQANDYRGQIWNRTRQELRTLLKREPTEMEYQMRNWYHFTWLSGDFNVEQHVHMLDICAWAINDWPTRVAAVGGRMARPDTGNIYDQFASIFEYKSGTRLYATCRQVRGVKVYRNIGVDILGSKGGGMFSTSKGRHHLMIDGKRWEYKGDDNDHYQTEHDELFRSIRAGNPINNGDYMAKSTLLAIMSRESAYTGEAVTWEEAMNSKQDLSPSGYTWDSDPPKSEVARPGETEFV